MVEVKTKNEETGEIIFEGRLNRREVGFLLNYAINDLMHAGVQFHLDREAEEDAEEEEQVLLHGGRCLRHPSRVGHDGRTRRERDQEKRPLEAGGAKSRSRVDEERCSPADDDRDHEHPIGLELERQLEDIELRFCWR